MENNTPVYGQAPVARPMSVGQWVVTLIITAIPLLNIIMLCVWAFGGDTTYPSRTNWAKASLIMMAIGLVLFMLFGGFMFSFFGSMMS